MDTVQHFGSIYIVLMCFINVVVVVRNRYFKLQ